MPLSEAFTTAELFEAVSSNPLEICNLITTLRRENKELKRKIEKNGKELIALRRENERLRPNASNGEKGGKRKYDAEEGDNGAPPWKRARTVVEEADETNVYDALRQEKIVVDGLGVLDPSFWDGYGPKALEKGTQTPVDWKQPPVQNPAVVQLTYRIKPPVQPSSILSAGVAGTPSGLRVEARSMYAREEEVKAGKAVPKVRMTGSHSSSPSLSPSLSPSFIISV